MFYEIVYEDGTVSVADYPDDDAAKTAVYEQHNRAKSGAKNGPQEGTATRVARVYVYANHPGDLGADDTLSSDEVSAALKAMLKDIDVVNIGVLATNIRRLTHPMNDDAEVHGSKFRQEADYELELELA